MVLLWWRQPGAFTAGGAARSQTGRGRSGRRLPRGSFLGKRQVVGASGAELHILAQVPVPGLGGWEAGRSLG